MVTPAAAARRNIHLVGSLPFDSTAEAMEAALTQLGERLRSLPDGETGARRNWIMERVESFRRHPDLELVREGDWSSYDKTPVFGIRRGHALRGESLDLGYMAAFEAGYPLFLERRRALGLTSAELAYQVGIPGDFDVALFTLGPKGPFLHREPFTEATLRELREIHARGGQDVVFQLEVPAELIFTTRMPGLLQEPMARFLAAGISRLAARSPEGARFGLHLCLGDLNHRALGRMRDVSPLVRLSNAVVRSWPAGRSLDYVHVPLAGGIEPPPVEPAFYEPLRRMRLPSRTRFIAGFVHEKQPLEEQRRVLALLEGLVGRTVDVAASCGLGRRERGAALANLERAATLAR
ncbi:MAG TPA: hypothetical protein VF794_08165 [Archangium sp.]|jgi:hypothetical protein|uniref:hypothetical protein n=1 Tax=Archangium sp. TaxID=1872627 RepID=UPI002EDB7AB0